MLAPSAVVLSLLVAFTHAFSFSTSTPTECQSLTVDWNGGQPPFSLNLFPVFGSPRNISIPTSAYSGTKGSFSFILPISRSKQFVLTMSDASGFAAGGTTPLLTAANGRAGSCNTTDPGVLFSFELNSALQQCRPYVFSGYSGAIQPLTIIGTVPGGSSFLLSPPVGSTSFSWTANVAAGTSLLFSMFDSQGRNGGTSDVKPVGATDDTTCINSQSPSSTASPSSTGTSPPSQSSDSGNPVSVAGIAGIAVGALLFLAAIITLVLFFLRRRQESHRRQHSLDLTSDPPLPHPQNNYRYSSSSLPRPVPSQYIPSGTSIESSPFLSSHPAAAFHSPLPSANSYLPHGLHPQQSTYYPDPVPYQPTSTQAQPSVPQIRPISTELGSLVSNGNNQSTTPGLVQPFNIHTLDESGSAISSQGKATTAGRSSHTPSRFIVHTDVEDALPLPNSDDVVELPPQYSERRQPLVITEQDRSTSGPSTRKSP